MAVAAPMDDVIAAVFLNLFFQPLARDTVRQKVGFDAAVRIDSFSNSRNNSCRSLRIANGREPCASPKTNSTRKDSFGWKSIGLVMGSAMS